MVGFDALKQGGTLVIVLLTYTTALTARASDRQQQRMNQTPATGSAVIDSSEAILKYPSALSTPSDQLANLPVYGVGGAVWREDHRRFGQAHVQDLHAGTASICQLPGIQYLPGSKCWGHSPR